MESRMEHGRSIQSVLKWERSKVSSFGFWAESLDLKSSLWARKGFFKHSICKCPNGCLKWPLFSLITVHGFLFVHCLRWRNALRCSESNAPNQKLVIRSFSEHPSTFFVTFLWPGSSWKLSDFYDDSRANIVSIVPGVSPLFLSSYLSHSKRLSNRLSNRL